MSDSFAWVRTLLACGIHTVLFMVAAWDIWAVASDKPELTVSHLIQRWAIENPVLPVAIGIVIGHLFWPIR